MSDCGYESESEDEYDSDYHECDIDSIEIFEIYRYGNPSPRMYSYNPLTHEYLEYTCCVEMLYNVVTPEYYGPLDLRPNLYPPPYGCICTN